MHLLTEMLKAKEVVDLNFRQLAQNLIVFNTHNMNIIFPSSRKLKTPWSFFCILDILYVLDVIPEKEQTNPFFGSKNASLYIWQF